MVYAYPVCQFSFIAQLLSELFEWEGSLLVCGEIPSLQWMEAFQ